MQRVFFIFLLLFMVSGCATKLTNTYPEHKESLPRLDDGGRIIFYSHISLLREIQVSTGGYFIGSGLSNPPLPSKNYTDRVISKTNFKINDTVLKRGFKGMNINSGEHPTPSSSPSCLWFFVDRPIGEYEITVFRKKLRDLHKKHLVTTLSAGQTRYIKVASWFGSDFPDHLLNPLAKAARALYRKADQGGNSIRLVDPNTAEGELRDCRHPDSFRGIKLKPHE